MNLGIQDAVALADVLERVIGGAPDELLDGYTRERRPIARQVVQFTHQLTRVATLPRGLRPARNAVMTLAGRVPAVQHALTWRLSGLVYR